MANFISSEERDAIGRRFGLLPQACQEALLVAAAIGTEFRVETVSAFCKRRVDQVREALEREAADGLLSAASDAVAIYRFSHPGIREILYEEIPAARRPWLRRQIAESLERQVGGSPRARKPSATGVAAGIMLPLETTPGLAARAFSFETIERPVQSILTHIVMLGHQKLAGSTGTRRIR